MRDSDRPEKITWNEATQSTSREIVGNVAYAALANNKIVFEWVISDPLNNSSGSEIFTHTIGGDFDNGLWNIPSVGNGRGFVMHSELLSGVQQNFITALSYDAVGVPVWSFGGANGDLLKHTSIFMEENRRTISCSTCDPIQYSLSSQAVGDLVVEFDGTATGWVDIINIDGGGWIAGSSNNTVVYGQITRSPFRPGEIGVK